MRFIGLVLLILSLCSCLQTENSNSLDDDLYSDNDAVRMIISQNCAACHVYHAQSDAELMASGLVIPGDPENSKLYYRLVGSTGGNGPKNMPTSGALTFTELTIIKEWIQNL